MNPYMNQFMYHESTHFTQPIVKMAKVNRFTVLESQNRPSTSFNTAVLKTWTVP